MTVLGEDRPGEDPAMPVRTYATVAGEQGQEPNLIGVWGTALIAADRRVS